MRLFAEGGNNLLLSWYEAAGFLLGGSGARCGDASGVLYVVF